VSNAQKGTVVTGFDGSERSWRAVIWALAEAEARKCDLVIVHAVEPLIVSASYGFPSAKIGNEHRVGTAEPQLARLVAACGQKAASITVTSRCVPENAAQALADVVAEVDASLLVLGASERGVLSRTLFGSTTDQLVHMRTCPPTVVHRGDKVSHRDGPVLAGADDAGASEAALGFALEFAALHDLPVHVVHTEANDKHLDEWRERYPQVPIKSVRVSDQPAQALLERSRQAQLLVVGVHRHTAIHRVLLGSVSHAALYHAECPVALLHKVSDG
jgi:nucleotide-binding universal stress UspA family protein